MNHRTSIEMQSSSKTATSILGQQIRILYAQGTTAVVISTAVSLLAAFYYWHQYPNSIIIVWAGLLTLVNTMRLLLFRWYTLSDPEDHELKIWLHRYIRSSFIGGASWGVLGLLYDPGWAVDQQVVLFVILAGIATAAVSSYTAVLRAYIVFLVPLLIPLIGQLFLLDSPASVFLGVIVLVFGAGLIAVARNFHSHIIATLKLAAEQLSLREAVLTGTRQLHRTESALRKSETRFGHLLETSQDGYWDWDVVSNQVHFSQRCKEQLGFRDDELKNDFLTWQSLLHPDDRERCVNKIKAYIDQPEGYWDESFRLQHKDGSYRWILSRAVPILNNNNELIRLSGVHVDITDRVQAEHEIQFLAYNDRLTELPNRLSLIDRLGHALATATHNGTKIFVLFIDLDRFKHINDSLGHPAGDSVLRAVADRFVSQIRKTDTVARLAADEFAVLIENLSDQKQASAIAEKLLICLKSPFTEENQQFYLSASIGISAFPGDGDEPTMLLENADTAMRRAKNTGRNQIQFYSEELTNVVRNHIRLEYGLRQALLTDQFEVYYQPKICLNTGHILGAEALLRWQHPEEGFISPQEFIPVAEECGLITEIGNWVLTRACSDAVTWKRQGLSFEHVAVNISGVQLQQMEFVQSVHDVLKSTALPAKYLELELTEHFLMKDAELSARLLNQLRRLGISIAIDDFGTGYSSLAYLTRFPINKLKIDRSFIGKICTNEQNAEISRTIINLGHSLNMKVVAEGIETGQQLKFLETEHCDEGQGYLIARPLPHDEFVTYLESFKNGTPAFRLSQEAANSCPGVIPLVAGSSSS
ncbi:MAG: EAL domain-containing protein [Gammaproteobacteria bacterium]|nr:EAL domain-containing protein [Gammaproteobacteria bacterium]